LDVIIAVGYRENSYQATQFRICATDVLKEFIVKGFVMEDERDATKLYMGLTNWKYAPEGKIFKSDTLGYKNLRANFNISRLSLSFARNRR